MATWNTGRNDFEYKIEPKYIQRCHSEAFAHRNCSLVCRFRAFALYVLYPCDRGEGKRKNHHFFQPKSYISCLLWLHGHSVVPHEHSCTVCMPWLLCTNSIASLCRTSGERDSKRQKGREVTRISSDYYDSSVCERTDAIHRAHSLFVCAGIASMCACCRWRSRVMQNNEPTRLGESVALNHFLFCSNDFLARLSDKRLVFSSIHISII